MIDQFPLYLIATLSILGLAPFVLMMVTSYVKIIVVTTLVRNALGVQQVPPAMVMNGLAIILTIFIVCFKRNARALSGVRQPRLKSS